MFDPPESVSLDVDLVSRSARTVSQGVAEVDDSSYPTMTGTSAKFPFRIDSVGISVKSLPSSTGWNALYAPVLQRVKLDDIK